MTYQPKSMLVTGGAGFIGSHFIRYVLKHHSSIRIINLDKLTYAGSLANIKPFANESQHHFIQGDINDETLIKHVMLHHHIDTIVHFAAESHVDRSIASPAAFVETNVKGTFTLLESARHHWFDVERCAPDHCRFHHISTDEVYGSLQIGDPAFTENTPYSPHSPYAASKAASDHLVRAYYHTYGLPITISNCSNNYGPNQHAEKFIPTIIRACLNQQPIPIYGTGKNIRDWLYVEDHCEAIMAVLQRGTVGESYNVGGNNEWENLELAKYICIQLDQLKPAKTPYGSLISFVPDRKGHDFRYAINAAKIKQKLGWSSNETLETGLKKTIEAFFPHPNPLPESS